VRYQICYITLHDVLGWASAWQASDVDNWVLRRVVTPVCRVCSSVLRNVGQVCRVYFDHVKQLNDIDLPNKSSQGVNCHTGSHSVTLHPTQVNAPRQGRF